MVGVKFSRIAEQKSAELADSLVNQLINSPRTVAYRQIDPELLREEYQGFFRSLTEWLLYRAQADIEQSCTQLGQRRASQGIPMEQCVNAMLLCRNHLVENPRREVAQKGDELFGELEFVVAVGQFFDDAIFFCMRGHREYALAVAAVA